MKFAILGTTLLALTVPAFAAEHKGEDAGSHAAMMRTHHPDAGQAGFVLELGDGRSLRVMCGDEGIAACMEAVRPIIDQLPSLANSEG